MKTQEVIKYYGSSKAMAQALGVSPAAVSQWGEYPPELRQHQIQNITHGKLVVGVSSASAKPFGASGRLAR